MAIDTKQIRLDPAMFYVGEDEESLVELGAMNNISFSYSFETASLTSDNYGEILTRIKSRSATISGDLMQIDLKNLADMQGIDDFEEHDEEGDDPAKRVFKTGSEITIKSRMVQLVSTNPEGKKFTITAYYAQKQGGFEFSFPSVDSDDPMTTSIEFRAIQDPNNQELPVFEIEDEVGVVSE